MARGGNRFRREAATCKRFSRAVIEYFAEQ
jgi:hypothetical protein